MKRVPRIPLAALAGVAVAALAAAPSSGDEPVLAITSVLSDLGTSYGVAVEDDGTVLVARRSAQDVVAVGPNGTFTRVAGTTGSNGFGGRFSFG